MRFFLLFSFSLLLLHCQPPDTMDNGNSSLHEKYFDQTGRSDILTGGIKTIPIKTPSGTFNVWTKRTGNNPDIKLLLLHGGPGANHAYFQVFDSYFPEAAIEYYYYDQLGSYLSDHPEDESLWEIDRFVEEVEQVRKSLNLTSDNYYLLGHSWGGILAIEYALKYQQHLKGMIISNMMCSITEYNKYAAEVLGPRLDPNVLAEIRAFEAKEDFTNPRYLDLITTHYYPEHVLRMPLEEWPEPVNRAFAHLNYDIYVKMQGPSEFGIAGDATLKDWDTSEDLKKISTPTLTIGAEYDTMDPKHMEWMSQQFPNGSYLHCPNGSHMVMYDDHKNYFKGLIKWMYEVNGDQ